MIVSIRNIAAVSALSLISTAAFAGDSCCGTSSYNGGITNIPVVAANNGACCGSTNSQIVGIPGVYVPSTTLGVSVGGTNVGSSNYMVGGNTYGSNNLYYGGNTYVGGNSYFGGSSASGGVSYIGGGGGSYTAPAPVSVGMIEGLATGNEAMEEVMETRTTTEIVPIRAVCMDGKGMPHPASRTNSDEKLAPQFNGEVYRCMAGTYMEVTIGRMVNGKEVFDGGSALSCQKGQALSYKGGNMTCVAQKPERDCNERSLLRRFGPGIKYVVLTRTQQVASQRKSQTQATYRSSMFVDGGVGQGVY